MGVRTKVKANARKAVAQGSVKTLSITLIIVCIWFLYAIFILGASAVTELFNVPLSTINIFSDWSYVFSPIIVGATVVLQVILFSPLAVGTARWFYRLAGADTPDVVDLFDFFSGAKRYFGSIWLELNLLIRKVFFGVLFLAVPVFITVLGSLMYSGALSAVLLPETAGSVAPLIGTMLIILGVVLLVVAVIFLWIFQKRYMLARYIYSSGECSAWRSVKQSEEFMKYRKSELFIFDISFILWWASCIAVAPALYVFPYYMEASAIYARVLIESAERRKNGTLESANVIEHTEPTQEFRAPPEETFAPAVGEAHVYQQTNAETEARPKPEPYYTPAPEPQKEDQAEAEQGTAAENEPAPEPYYTPEPAPALEPENPRKDDLY